MTPKLALPLILSLLLSACGAKPSVETSGEMTQHLVFDQPNVTLEDSVKSFYKNILGREPTPQELASALAQIRGNLISLSQLGQQLAASQEAWNKVTQLVLQHLGTVSAQTIQTWITQLGQGLTLAQIEHLLTAQ